jgi:hypothetical protein
MVKVTILDEDADLKPEMSAKATFLELQKAGGDPAQPPPAVVSVPKDAVATREGRSVVFEVRDGKARVRGLTLGGEREGRVVVKEGLAGGETLVSRPPDGLKDGDEVRIKS